MRGGSQSQLIQGHDGRFYVAKFRGNPQGDRTLINEWIATKLLRKLEISAPPLAFLAYDPQSLKQSLSFTIGGREVPIEAGLHLGSLCPVDPTEKAIYDFLPHRLLEKTVNLEDFTAMLIADTFLNQADRRQAIFVRVRSRQGLAFRAFFIDHGMIFGGSAWHLNALQSDHCYFDRLVYSKPTVHSLCEHMIERIESLTERDLLDLASGIPEPWFGAGEYDLFANLCASLNRRKNHLQRLVSNQLNSLGLDCSKRPGGQPFSSDSFQSGLALC
jgi:hypothetical protein